MMRLVQLQNGSFQRVALVQEPHLQLLVNFDSIYRLALKAITSTTRLSDIIQQSITDERLDYDAVYHSRSPWRLLPPITHPDDPARCHVSGTGLTHLGSAKERNAMHAASEAELTDSMKMFRCGLEGGRPDPGEIGVPPEWFHKGNGTILRAHGEPLHLPAYADDGGEEAEIAGAYIVGADGQPYRIGMCVGNEFSDHRFEKKNYLNLAGSKIRTCALGPELVVAPDFQSVPGKVSIIREGRELWSKEICTGENEMCHSLQNIEHHHFKFETHRRSGDVHVHYFGACSLSFGAGIDLMDGDVMEIGFEGFGRTLCNPLSVAPRSHKLIGVRPL